MDVGTKVRLTRDVERYPHFIAKEGMTGTVTSLEDELIAVRLDEELEGASEWDNEVHWYPDMYVETDHREAFEEDVEVIE